MRTVYESRAWEPIAYEVGIHPTYISTVENGQRNVGVVNVVKIAAALNLDPADLVEGLGV